MQRVMRISADKFSVSIKDMLDDIDEALRANLAGCVRESCKMGARLTRRNAKKQFRTDTSAIRGNYSKTFSYKVTENRSTVYGEVGNKKYPGLVHLLEKGHRTINGAASIAGGKGTINAGFVPAYPHMAPAAEETFAHFNKLVDRAVEKAVK